MAGPGALTNWKWSDYMGSAHLAKDGEGAFLASNGKTYVVNNTSIFEEGGTLYYNFSSAFPDGFYGTTGATWNRAYKFASYGDWVYCVRIKWVNNDYVYMRMYAKNVVTGASKKVVDHDRSTIYYIARMDISVGCDISIDPTTGIGILNMACEWNDGFTYKSTMYACTFTAPLSGTTEPAFSSAIRNDDQDGFTGYAPGYQRCAAYGNVGLHMFCLFNMLTLNKTVYIRKSANLASPTDTAVTSFAGGKNEYLICLSPSGPGLHSLYDDTPTTIRNFDRTLSWAIGGSAPVGSEVLNFLGEDSLYYYVQYNKDMSGSYSSRILALLKTGTTFSTVETLSGFDDPVSYDIDNFEFRTIEYLRFDKHYALGKGSLQSPDNFLIDGPDSHYRLKLPIGTVE